MSEKSGACIFGGITGMTKNEYKTEEKQIVSDIIIMQRELNELKKEHGLEEEEKGIKKAVSDFFDYRETREKVLINKKKYIYLLVFLGIFGVHRFLTKQYSTAVLYLLTFWTGFSFSMSFIDLLIVIPMKSDENGNILI